MLIEAQPYTNILLQTMTNKHSGTNLQKNLLECMIRHKNAPTNTNLQYYCSMHTLSPNIQIKPYMLPHTYRSSHTTSHTHTDQSIQSLIHIQGKAYKLHTHTEQNIQYPTHIQSKAHNLPHTYGSEHTINREDSPTNMLPQTHWSRHTTAQRGLLPKLLVKAHIQLRISSRGYWLAIHDPRTHVPVSGEKWLSKNTTTPIPQQSHLPWQTGLSAL